LTTASKIGVTSELLINSDCSDYDDVYS